MTNDTNLSFGIKLPFRQQCNLPECQKPTNYVYRVNIDQHRLSFCSNDHARTGLSRWEEKKKLGIKPGMPRQKEEIPEVSGDNIQEVEEKGI